MPNQWGSWSPLQWSSPVDAPEIGPGWRKKSARRKYRLTSTSPVHKYLSPVNKVYASLIKALNSIGKQKPSIPKLTIPKKKMPGAASIPRKAKSSVKASMDPLPLSAYEIQNQENHARNRAKLRALGLVGDALGLAKTVAPRASPCTVTKVGQLGTRSSERPKALPDRLDLYDLST